MADHHLPYDVMSDILSRLPVKSLLRFQSVSHPWLSLISHPHFIKHHLDKATRLKDDLDLMVSKGNNFVYSVDYHTSSPCVYSVSEYTFTDPIKIEIDSSFNKNRGRRVYIVGSCNGLLCIIYGTVCVLWNPSTKETKHVPRTCIKPRDYVLHGFGYDSATDDYKVVKINYSKKHKSFTQGKVYTLRTNTWTGIDPANFPLHLGDYKTPMNGVLVNGALHWLGGRVPNEPLNLLAFDMIKETFNEVPVLPKDGYMFSREATLGVLSGCLCITLTDAQTIDLWMMNDYGVRSSWTKRYSILRQDPVRHYHYWNTICSTKDGEILLVMNFNELVVFDPYHEKARTIKVSGLFCGQFTCMVRSLVSFKSIMFVQQRKKRRKANKRKRVGT